MTGERVPYPAWIVVALLLASCGESAINSGAEPSSPSKPVVEAHELGARDQQVAQEPATPEPSLLAVRSIVGVGRSFLAVMADGSVRGWGANPDELLGPASAGQRVATPIATPIGARDLITHNDWLGPLACWRDSEAAIHCRGTRPDVAYEWLSGRGLGPVADVGTFAVHRAWACAVAADGLTCRGRPGPGFTEHPLPKASAVEELAAIAPTLEHACALERDGGVICWGHSGSGRLGDFWRAMGFDAQWTATPKRIAGIDDAVELVAASELSCARHRSGRVSCWGAPFDKPMRLAGIEQAVQLVAEGRRVCIVLADGGASCLASDPPGSWSGTVRSEPETAKLLTPLIDRSDLRAVALGPAAACVLVESGEVLCWGDNREGQLGDGTLIDHATPAPVAHLRALELPSPPAAPAEPISPIRQEWTKLPEGCSHQAKPALQLAKRSSEGFEVQTAYAVLGSRQLEVHLLDYHGFPDPEFSLRSPRGRQRELSISIPVQPGGDPVGVYELGGGTKLDLRIVLQSQDQWSSITNLGTHGTVEISRVDDAWVCGTVAVESGDDRLNTSFAARRVSLPEPE